MPKKKKNEEVIIDVEKEVEEVVGEITKIPVATGPKPKVHYIDNEKFLKELLEYFTKCKVAKETGKEPPAIPNYIGDCFHKIAVNLSRRPNFVNYSYKDEMIGDGVENCLMYFRNFDPAKSSNPFSYFTQIIYFAFIRRIGKEKKQSYIKYKMTEQHGVFDTDMAESASDEYPEHRNQYEALYDNMADYIHTFEEKVEAKRQKRRSKKKEDLPDEKSE